jgi:hypothetical protein
VFVTFSPDEKQIISTYRSGTVDTRDIESGNIVNSSKSHSIVYRFICTIPWPNVENVEVNIFSNYESYDISPVGKVMSMEDGRPPRRCTKEMR